MTQYPEDRPISYRECFLQIMKEMPKPNGWSALEMCQEMTKRKWISPFDTVIDIADEMRKALGPAK